LLPARVVQVIFAFMWNTVVFKVQPGPLEAGGAALIITGCLVTMLPQILGKKKTATKPSGEDKLEKAVESSGEGRGEGEKDEEAWEKPKVLEEGKEGEASTRV
jgi:hypothetical protein